MLVSGVGMTSLSDRIRQPCIRSSSGLGSSAVVPWLLLNRRGLTILVHPETGDDYEDHAQHALWLGAILPLRLDAFTGGADGG